MFIPALQLKISDEIKIRSFRTKLVLSLLLLTLALVNNMNWNHQL